MKKIGIIVIGAFMFTLASCGGNGSGKAQNEKKEEVKAEVKKEVKEEPKKEETTAAKDVDGKALFMSSGCVACHQKDKKTTGPALVDIAKGYAGKKDDILKFFKGEGKSIIDPAQFSVMKPNLEITKKMSDAERSALADYILAQK